jgi:hypothetical protein
MSETKRESCEERGVETEVVGGTGGGGWRVEGGGCEVRGQEGGKMELLVSRRREGRVEVEVEVEVKWTSKERNSG